MGDADAEKFASGFSFFDAKALQNLGVGGAIARVERAEYDFNLQTEMLRTPDGATAESKAGKIRAASREQFARPREEVEAEIKIPEFKAPEPKSSEKRDRTEPSNEIESQEVEGASAQVNDQTPIPEAPEEKQKVTIPKPEPDFPRIVPEPVTDTGTREHLYLQSLIKRMGEGFGFRATIEKAVLDRHGRVDVALENDSMTIACEISVTNEPDYEVGNIKKCLAAGFDHVVVISSNERHLRRISKLAAEEILEAEMTKVGFMSAEEFYSWLEGVAGENEKTETVKGFKVKMKVKPGDGAKQTGKNKTIKNLILGAIKKLKDGSAGSQNQD